MIDCPESVRKAVAFQFTTAGSYGPEVTVTTAVPLCPSLVAMIVEVPTPIARTKPSAKTITTVESLADHVICRPKVTPPSSAVSVAWNLVVSFRARLTLPGVTATVLIGGGVDVTAMLAVAVGDPVEVVTVN